MLSIANFSAVHLQQGLDPQTRHHGHMETHPPAAAHPGKGVGLLNSYPFCHVQAQQRKYDTMDLVASIYRRLRSGGFPGTELHSLYRDEVQVRLLSSFPGNCEVQHYFRALRASPGTAHPVLGEGPGATPFSSLSNM